MRNFAPMKEMAYTLISKNTCLMCNKKFVAAKFNPKQKYCGSYVRKEGCSYQNAKNLRDKYHKANPGKYNLQQRAYYRKKRNTLPENYRIKL